MANTKTRVELYGLKWNPKVDPLQREIEMCRKGGKWIFEGKVVGNGMQFHFRELQNLLYGKAKAWHRWNEIQVNLYADYGSEPLPDEKDTDQETRLKILGARRKYRTIVGLGPKSSGKTNGSATDILADYYCWPECTTVLVTTTTRESLENRVWGELKKYHRIARKRWPWLPGHLIEGRQRIVTDAKIDFDEDGRDFRCGMMGLACKRGNEMVNIADFAGIKNSRVRVLADELSHFPKSFVDIIANLDANFDFVFYGLGNPKETTDALGYIGEPAPHLGGWEGGIDQSPGTKTWELRRPKGIAFQFPGDDSPNFDGHMNIPLITSEMMETDKAFYGEDSWQYQMMNLGRMPKGQGSRRVLTRQLCHKFHALDQPMWKDNNRTRIACLDAAYRGVGGDRCVFAILEFGEQVEPPKTLQSIDSPLAQPFLPSPRHKQVLSIASISIIPVSGSTETESPEDQIVQYVKQQCTANGIPAENLFFDAGMRTSLVTAFSRLWTPNIESIDCGGRPTEQAVSNEISTPASQYYSKFITELWYSVRLCVESGQFRGMNEEVMWEFCTREWRIVAGNKIEVESKADMKTKLGRSPDLADCIAIGLFGARQRGFKISKLGSPELRGNSGNSLLRKLSRQSRSIWGKGQLQTA